MAIYFNVGSWCSKNPRTLLNINSKSGWFVIWAEIITFAIPKRIAGEFVVSRSNVNGEISFFGNLGSIWHKLPRIEISLEVEYESCGAVNNLWKEGIRPIKFLELRKSILDNSSKTERVGIKTDGFGLSNKLRRDENPNFNASGYDKHIL